MTLEILQNEMTKALREGNKARKIILGMLVGAVQSATITPTGRVELTEQLVDNVLIKQAKLVKEQIDMCPASRPEMLDAYKYQLAVIEEFAPVQITDKAVIRKMIEAAIKLENISLDQKARKVVMPKLKDSGADMKVVNQVFTQMLKEI
jgi:uncharacterized protein YqeY